jgi:hypothetical protein
MAVMVILGLILTFVTVRLDGLTSGSRLRASAREMGSLVGVAFSSAVATGKSRTVRIDLETGEYWIGFDLETPLEEAEVNQRLYGDVEVRDIQIGDRVFEDRGVLTLEISPLGLGSDALFHLRSESGEEMTVEVRPLTGTIRFHEGYKEYEEPDEENE